jgi:hypothetical protein
MGSGHDGSGRNGQQRAAVALLLGKAEQKQDPTVQRQRVTAGAPSMTERPRPRRAPRRPRDRPQAAQERKLAGIDQLTGVSLRAVELGEIEGRDPARPPHPHAARARLRRRQPPQSDRDASGGPGLAHRRAGQTRGARSVCGTRGLGASLIAAGSRFEHARRRSGCDNAWSAHHPLILTARESESCES